MSRRRDRYIEPEIIKVVEEKEEDLIENLVPGISKDELESLRKNAIDKAKTTRHSWKQKGFWLVCRSCEYPHSSWIGPGKVMVGEQDDGTPIFQ